LIDCNGPNLNSTLLTQKAILDSQFSTLFLRQSQTHFSELTVFGRIARKKQCSFNTSLTNLLGNFDLFLSKYVGDELKTVMKYNVIIFQQAALMRGILMCINPEKLLTIEVFMACIR
jgi:hypothetical protein